MTDIQTRYRVVSSGFDTVVRAVGGDQWDEQSPCESWRARDVVTHVVEGHRGVIARVGGVEPEPVGEDQDPKEQWVDAYRAMDELTGDSQLLAQEIDGPTGKVPAARSSGSS